MAPETSIALVCAACGREIPRGAPFCASCGTPASAAHGSAAPVHPPRGFAAPVNVPAPRSGGSKGFLFALGSLGCMGVIALGVVVLGVVLYLAGTGSVGRGGDSGDGPVYNQQLAEFLPQELGGFQLQKVQPIDAESITMLGAADAVRGRYSSGMSVLVLNYTSADRAGRGVGPVRTAMFPDAQGWKIVEDKAETVGRRVAVLHADSGRLATIWNHGSLVLIFLGDAGQMPAFEKSAPDLLSKTQAQPQPAARG